MRVMLDSNVLFSGLFFEGNEHELLRQAVSGSFTPVIPQYVSKEVNRIISEKMSQSKRKEAALANLAAIEKSAEIVSEAQAEPCITLASKLIRDKKDAPVLAAALAAKPDVLITGDEDFFHLKGRVPFKVMTAARFLYSAEAKANAEKRWRC